MEGGNLVSFAGDVSTIKADITAATILFNSIIYIISVRLVCCYNKKLYLGTPMEGYIRLFLKLTQEEITSQYSLREIKYNVYINRDKEMNVRPTTGWENRKALP